MFSLSQNWNLALKKAMQHFTFEDKKVIQSAFVASLVNMSLLALHCNYTISEEDTGALSNCHQILHELPWVYWNTISSLKWHIILKNYVSNQGVSTVFFSRNYLQAAAAQCSYNLCNISKNEREFCHVNIK